MTLARPSPSLGVVLSAIADELARVAGEIDDFQHLVGDALQAQGRAEPFSVFVEGAQRIDAAHQVVRQLAGILLGLAERCPQAWRPPVDALFDEVNLSDLVARLRGEAARSMTPGHMELF